MVGFIIGIVVLSVAVILIRAVTSGIEGSKHYFVCRNCGGTFKPKWTQMCFNIHVFDEHELKCPHCNIIDLCGDKGKTLS